MFHLIWASVLGVLWDLTEDDFSLKAPFLER